MAHLELIGTGNEVLNGDVLDTNSHWLCRQFTGMGATVDRAVMVRDDLSAIATEIRQALARRPRIILTFGGMGPTTDDQTIAAVAAAVELPLVESPEAVHMIGATYAKFAREGIVSDGLLTPARRKMALVPRGASVMLNPVGAAPAVILSVNHATIISLPGVPAELQGIVEGPLMPVLHVHLGAAVFREWEIIVHCNDESLLAPLLEQIARRHPKVYIKSHAQRFGPDVHFRVTVSLAGATLERVHETLSQTAQDIEDTLRGVGVATEPPVSIS